ncbi:SGNH/GDSL hydrolase family protein [Blastomonas sp.]|uniref:SGNH/GDSL hydrolase family protein n=1 Tax=Blastomonas sp. TaxID=1909299 RepID=UPI00391D861A
MSNEFTISLFNQEISFDLFDPNTLAARGFADDAAARAADAAESVAAAGAILAPLTLAQAKINASFETITSIAVDRPAAGNYNTGDSTNLAVAIMAGEDVPADTPLGTLSVPFTFDSSAATKIIVKRSSRLDSDAWLNSQPSNAGDTIIDEREFTLASVGLVSGVGGVAQIPLGGQFAPAGTLLIFDVVAVNGSGVPQYNNLSHGPVSGATQQYQYGWYRFSGQPDDLWETTPLIGIRPAFAVTTELFDTGVSTVKTDPFRSRQVSVSISGTNLTLFGSLYDNGNTIPVSENILLSPPASGKERIFAAYADRLTGEVTTESTPERDEQLDAIEYLPDTPAGKILLARALVRSDSSATAANCAEFRGLIRIGQEGSNAAHVARNRAILRRLLGKAMRGEPIKWGGYGDSITALQTGAPSDDAVRYAANGEWRDRRSVYFSQYPSDTLALLPLYDFGDGSGAVHTKIGWNWSIKAVLDELAGSEVVEYPNFGIGSTTSANSDNNGLWPARIAVPLAADLDAVAIAFGMNELGQATTYGNIVNMIGQFRDVGTACVVIDCPRPNASESVTDWRYTSSALEAAAYDAGAAFVSFAAIADDRNLGGMGVPAEALGSTNIVAAGNHPGIYELNRYGRAAVEQLGFV